jgi:hypothetical protein
MAEQPENLKGKDFRANPQNINTTGKNKGAKWLSTRLREMLESNDGRDKLLTALLQKAEKGDVNAIKEIFDRIDGKVTQEIDQKTEHSGGIRITWEDPNPGQGKSTD